MTNDTACAVLPRLQTAIMALTSAIGEAAQPPEARDTILLETLLEALRQSEAAEAMCNAVIRRHPQ